MTVHNRDIDYAQGGADFPYLGSPSPEAIPSPDVTDLPRAVPQRPPESFGIIQKPMCPEHGPMRPVCPISADNGVVAYLFSCHTGGCLWEAEATPLTVRVYLLHPI